MNLDEEFDEAGITLQSHESTVLILTGGEDVENLDETVCYFMNEV